MATPSTAFASEPSQEDINSLIVQIKDWSIANGLAVRPPPALVKSGDDPYGVLATTAPVTIFPSPFPKVCFDQAKAIQKAYNELYASISRDEDFLQRVVEEILEVDEFIAQLWQVHLKVKEDGYSQTLSLGLFRSDYMVHQEEDGNAEPQIKQVEFNTIASSFGGLSSQTSKLHKFLSKHAYSELLNGAGLLPENDSAKGLAAGLRAAHEAYIKDNEVKAACILFIVQDAERNVFDQRHLEYSIEDVPVFRLPFSQILDHTSLAPSAKRELLYHPPHSPQTSYHVSTVYYRAGYGPSDYPSPASWQARLHVERSNAIKCPSILTQLAGAKKVQQVLATPGSDLLGRFLPKSNTSSSVFRGLEATFTNIYPMDESAAGLAARKLALDEEQCMKYVLKPQREGGGNNVYRSAIPPFLKSMPESHWKSFILMEIIQPPPVTNMILRNGVVEKGGVICELGVYGTVLWDQKSGDTLHNQEAGYLLRTKGDKSEEGGVAAGFGSMDSVLLV